MNELSPLHQQLFDIFRAYPHDPETAALDYGWYHAWVEKPKGPSGRLFYVDEEKIELSEQEWNAFIPFIADKLLEADPTPDKIYAPYLFRWFRYGMHYSNLDLAKEILERYHHDRENGIAHKIERYANINYVPT